MLSCISKFSVGVGVSLFIFLWRCFVRNVLLNYAVHGGLDARYWTTGVENVGLYHFICVVSV
jgi:hypothetical protein